MQRLVVGFACLLLVCGALARLSVLRGAPVTPQFDAASIRHELLGDSVPTASRPSEALRRLGVRQVIHQQYQPGAVVVLQPGRDRQPGVAGVDDNRDGVIDDRGELGATLSDDVCLVRAEMTAEDEQREDESLASFGQRWVVLEQGAFVPADSDQSWQSGDDRMRLFVYGATGDDPWSMMIWPRKPIHGGR